MGARRADQPVRPKVKINPPESLGLGSVLVIKGSYAIIKGYQLVDKTQEPRSQDTCGMCGSQVGDAVKALGGSL